MEKSIAIITARGGSKRIPKKNIRNFCGRPIIEYVIEAAVMSGIFDEVMVSTESDEIAGISVKAGAKVPFMRSEKNSDDFSSTADVLMEVLEKYKSMGREFSNICCLYPTAPFITSEKLIKGMELLEQADSVLPVVAYSFPPQRCVIIEDNRVKPKWPESQRMRSQDLETWYHDCGQFYCLKTESFLKEGNIIFHNTIPLIMSELEVQDIDNIEDWKIAELKYLNMIDKKKGDNNVL